MDIKLLAQLKTWNPWWQQGKIGIKRYNDPQYKRELYYDVYKHLKKGNQIISIVGMRQVGKSTLMRQMIKQLLKNNIDPRTILYVSFDDPYLRVHYKPDKLFDLIIQSFIEGITECDLDNLNKKIYLFLDEIHQLPSWENKLKSYYDRAFPMQYIISGSSSLHLQKKNRESLLGRIVEHTLWPFSFREYVEYFSQKTKNKELPRVIQQLRIHFNDFLGTFDVVKMHSDLSAHFKQISIWHKNDIVKYLKKFIISGGFPRAWQQPDFVSRQKFLWEQHIGKVIFEDLVQIAKIRKPKI